MTQSERILDPIHEKAEKVKCTTSAITRRETFERLGVTGAGVGMLAGPTLPAKGVGHQAIAAGVRMGVTEGSLDVGHWKIRTVVVKGRRKDVRKTTSDRMSQFLSWV